MKNFLSFHANNARRQARIDILPCPVLLCDRECRITYANLASLILLNRLQPHLPFAAGTITGASLSLFHADLVTYMQQGRRMEVSAGNARLTFHAVWLRDAKGESDGAFIDWDVLG